MAIQKGTEQKGEPEGLPLFLKHWRNKLYRIFKLYKVLDIWGFINYWLINQMEVAPQEHSYYLSICGANLTIQDQEEKSFFTNVTWEGVIVHSIKTRFWGPLLSPVLLHPFIYK